MISFFFNFLFFFLFFEIWFLCIVDQLLRFLLYNKILNLFPFQYYKMNCFSFLNFIYIIFFIHFTYQPQCILPASSPAVPFPPPIPVFPCCLPSTPSLSSLPPSPFRQGQAPEGLQQSRAHEVQAEPSFSLSITAEMIKHREQVPKSWLSFRHRSLSHCQEPYKQTKPHITCREPRQVPCRLPNVGSESISSQELRSAVSMGSPVMTPLGPPPFLL